ncbi:LOW QUALITY PROTEIN: ribosome quality control complex subunit TCF25-like [Urocitellus parryii]
MVVQSNASGKLWKKEKKQKNKKNSTGEALKTGLEDIDRILERIEDGSGLSRPGPLPLTSRKHVLYVEHRHLNPDTELKRYFGARAILGEQRLRQRQRVYPKCTLTTPKSTWPWYSKPEAPCPGLQHTLSVHSHLPGLSTRLLETKKGLSFCSEEYQQAQHKYLVAVESMEPNNIVVLLQTSPYHVDSLLQLSDACHFQEDQEMARDLIERALYSMECAFHPLFSLTSGTRRLDYRRPKNRSFYLALYKQMSFLEKRGCPRTTLEFCKLILSLEPDEDPLCMLLLVDHLALRARNYEYLICLFQEWEAHRNLSQLPNFAFSVALAYFLLSQQTDLPQHELSSAREKASLLIQQALTMFPGVLMPLLEYCSVRPDATVSNHHFFGPDAEISQPPALTQLVSLYFGRLHFLWKKPATMSWLEENVCVFLQAVDAGDPAVEACVNRRKMLYQCAPRNIHRHVILSEIREAVAALPPPTGRRAGEAKGGMSTFPQPTGVLVNPGAATPMVLAPCALLVARPACNTAESRLLLWGNLKGTTVTLTLIACRDTALHDEEKGNLVFLGIKGKDLSFCCAEVEGQPTLQLKEVSIMELYRENKARTPFLVFHSLEGSTSVFQSASHPGWFIATSSTAKQPVTLTQERGLANTNFYLGREN